MSKEINNQNDVLLNLLKEKKSLEDRKILETREIEQRRLSEAEIEKVENKKIIEESGLPKLFQTIIESGAIEGNLSLEWSNNNSFLSLVDKNNREIKTIIKSGLTENKKVGLIWQNEYHQHSSYRGEHGRTVINEVCMPIDSYIAEDIFDNISVDGVYKISKRKIRIDKENEIKWEIEKDNLEKQNKIDKEILYNSFLYKYINEIIDSKTIKREKTTKPESFLKKLFYVPEYDYAYINKELDKAGFIFVLSIYSGKSINFKYSNNKYLMEYHTGSYDEGEDNRIEINENNIIEEFNIAIKNVSPKKSSGSSECWADYGNSSN